MQLDPTADNLVPEVVIQELDDYPIVDIALDSRAGYIYWHTDRALEVARLDGQNTDNIHREQNTLSGKLFLTSQVNK